MKRQVGSYDEDNAGAARFEGDGVGLPESPIYSNFSKHLWTGHTRLGGVQKSDRFRENTDGHSQAPVASLPPSSTSATSGADAADVAPARR